MKKIMILLVVLLGTSGFIGGSHKSMSDKEKNKVVAETYKLIERGEYYRAGQKADQLLEVFPDDPKVRALDTEVETRQAERYRSLRGGNLAGSSELSPREKQDAIKTLSERADELYRSGSYAEAIEAAQEIFKHDPDNAQASRLMDKIGQTERDRADQQNGLLREVYRDEMTERMEVYRKEAQRAMDDGRFGRARFALEKMLLLEPNDPEANRLYETVLHQLEKKAA